MINPTSQRRFTRTLAITAVILTAGLMGIALSTHRTFGQAQASPKGWGSAALIRVFDHHDNAMMFRNTQVALIKSPKVINSTIRSPQVKKLAIVNDQRDPASWLESVLTVEVLPNTELIKVSVALPPSTETASLVNAVVDTYLTDLIDEKHRARLARLETLTSLNQVRKQELRTKRAQLLASASESRDAGVGNEIMRGLDVQDLQENRKALRKIRLQKVATEMKLARLKAAPVNPATEVGNLETTLAILNAQDQTLRRDEEKTLMQLAKASHAVDVLNEHEAIATLENVIRKVEEEIARLDTEMQAPDRITLISRAEPPSGR